MKKRILSIILCVCMMLSLLPTAALAFLNLTMTIGGTNVAIPTTVGNYTYGTYDGTTCAATGTNVAALPESGWTWAICYHAEDENSVKYTLTLNNINIQYTGTGNCIQYYNMGLNLVLVGVNTINAPNAGTVFINEDTGALYISGTGSLNTTGSGIGICAGGDISISSGTVTVKGASAYALRSVHGNIFITGGTVTATAGDHTLAPGNSCTTTVSGGSAYYSTSSDGSNLQTYVSGGSGGKFFVYNAKMLVLANDEFVGYTDFTTGWNAAVAATSAIVTLFDDWTATDGSFGTGDGFGSGAIYIPKNKTITLDLNGHNIDRALTAASTSGHVIWVSNGGILTIQDSGSTDVAKQGEIKGGYNSAADGGGIMVTGTLTLTGGNITGNRAKYWGGGVYVAGSFKMTGGKISGNLANYQNDANDGGAGGVYVGTASFTMTGGEISGNYACKERYGGVYADSNGNIAVGGTAKIEGNLSGCTYSAVDGTSVGTIGTESSAASNVYLPSGKTITCSTGSNALKSGASIGVTTAATPVSGTPVTVTGSNSADYSSYFSSDAGYYSVNTGSGDAQVVKLQTEAPTVNAAKPSITTDLSTTEVDYTQNAAATALTIAASVSDGGTLSYQWYSNDTNDTTTPTAVGTNSATYTPPTTSTGTTYYYCVVTNTNTGVTGNQTAATTSNIAKITVNAAATPAAAPVIDTNLSPNQVNYTVGATATALTITAHSTDGGMLSYQWYSKTSSGGTGSLISGAESASYTPPTNAADYHYYYCIVTNTKSGQTATTTSADVAISVVIPSLNFLDSHEVTMPTTVGNYTYGTCDGTTFAETAANADTLPKSGWTWAIQYHTADANGVMYTLTLNNININYTDTSNCIEYYGMNLNLVLKGDNTIYAPDAGTAFISESYADVNALYISGTGSLAATGKSLGICAGGDLTISSGTVSVKTTNNVSYALRSVYGNISITGGTVTATATRGSALVPGSGCTTTVSGGNAYYSTNSDGSNLQAYVSGSGGCFFVYNAAMLVTTDSMTVGYADCATGWNAAISAGTATVKLLADWTATGNGSNNSFGTGEGFSNGAILVSVGKDITLDLNGHNINRALTAVTTDGCVIKNGGTLTLNDSSTATVADQGKITGGYNEYGGGVSVVNSSNFTMNGGTISGNKATACGGGVYVSTGSFTMRNGKISDNAAPTGGGVHVPSPSNPSATLLGGIITNNHATEKAGGLGCNNTVTVGGTINITGNTATASNTTSNLYVYSGKTITCSTTTPLTSGASIGVTTATAPVSGTPVAITGSNSANYSSYFSSDAGYTVANTGSGDAQVVKLQLEKPTVNAATPSITTNLSTTEVTYTQNDDATTLTVAASVTDGGTLSYQWYSNDTNDTTTPTAVGTNSATYTPLTTSTGTTYYYCVVTNAITDNGDGGTKTAKTTSNIAKITVNAAASNVMSVDLDGAGGNAPTLYTDFATGWSNAVGNSNTANTVVKLLADWTTTDSLSVPSGKVVFLDLNGKTINRNLSVPKDDGYAIYVEGTLTITDSSAPDTGKITGGYSNSSTRASGIQVTGTLNLLGGSVSGNQYGAAVMSSGSGRIVVGGTAVVKDNTGTSGGNSNLKWDKDTCSISATTPLTSGAEIHITTDKPTLGTQVLVTANNVTSGTTANYFKTDLGDEYEVSDAGSSLYVKDKTRTVKFNITKDGSAYTLPGSYQIEVHKSGENGSIDTKIITAAQMNTDVELAVGTNEVAIWEQTSSNSASKQSQTALTVTIEEGSNTQNITLAYYSLDIKDSTNNLSLMGTTLPLIAPTTDDMDLTIIPAVNRRLISMKSVTMGGATLTEDDAQTSYYEYASEVLDLLGYFMLNQVTGAVVIDVETSNEFPVAADGSDKAVTATNWSTMCDSSWLGSNYDTQTEWSISTPAQLAAFAAAVNSGKDFAEKTVKLTADLDMSGYLWTSIGVIHFDGGSKPFCGTFDGQGHSISGLFQNDITSDVENGGAGLFAENEGTIKSLTVKNSLVASWYYVAAAVGGNAGMLDDILVENSSVFGYVYVGGITALNRDIVKNCGVDAKIVNTNSDGASGGMIASTNCDEAVIQNCWSLGSIEGDWIGGITGENAGTISNCWSAATVENGRESISHHNYANNSNGTIENCYGLASRNITDSSGTVTGCGTFATATGALTAGTAGNCGSAQTLSYGSTNLLTALNGWREAQGTPTNYLAWVQPSVDAKTYPGFKSASVEEKVSIFNAKFYEPQLWDCQRSPAFPVEGRSFRISGLKAPYDQNLQKISFASSDDYVTFVYVSAVSELPTDVQNRIVSSVKRYTGATEEEIRAAAVVKEVLHSGAGQATETTLSTYGLVWGLSEEGFLYTALDGAYKYSGGVGTFVSFKAHKSGDSVIYTTDQDKPYTKDQLDSDSNKFAPEDGEKTAPNSVTYQELIRVVDGSGTAVSGATVKITVNSTIYTGTTNTNGYAQFSELPAQAVTSATVQSGSYATLTYDAVASPEAVLVYANPSGNGSGSQQAKVTVTVNHTGSGTVEYLGAGTGTNPYTLASGDTAMFSITPADGYEITAATWGGANVLSEVKDGFFSATVSESKAFAVTFSKITPTDGIGNVKFTTRNLFDTQRSAAFPQNGRIMNFFGLKAPYDNSLHTVTLTSGQYIKFELISSVESAGKTDAFYNSVHWYSGATKQQVGEAAYVKEVLYNANDTVNRDLGTGMIWAYEDESFGFLFTALDGSYASSAGVGTLFTFQPAAYGSHLALKTDIIKPLPYGVAGNELDWGNYKPIVIPDNGQNIDETYNYSGIILDENGNPKSNVEVKIVIGDDTYTTTTDDKGRFILPDLPYDGNGELTIGGNDIGNGELTDDDTKGFGNDVTERTDTGDYTNVFKDDGTTYQKLSAPTYLLTVNLNGGNGGTTGGGYAFGASVPINAGSRSGYTFSGWTTSNGGAFASASSANTTFTMPTAATTIAATWTASGGSSSRGVSSTTKADPVYVDGTEYDIGNQTGSGDKTTVTVDQTKLTEQIDKATTDVLVPVSDKTNTAVAQLVVKNVEDMAKKGMTLSVQTGDVTYQMPTTAVDTETLMTTLGATDASKVPVNVTITNLEAGSVTTDKGTVVLNPVEFTVTATYGGKTVEVELFSRYVQRVIELPVGYDASKITTAIRTDDGEHVPTQVYQKDGKYYVKINSLTNSTYALIYNQQNFADASGKWYEAAADEMASRCVIFGRTDGSFDGEANVTRAEFAAIIVRALGLPSDGTENFTDVADTAWCAGAIGAAYEYGIVNGRTSTIFDPNACITRQEAMAMIQRAAEVAEFTGTTGSLAAFSDADSVGAWAKDAVAFNVGSGLIVGADGKLNVNAPITRAQTAVIVLRLLQKAELVDVRTTI